MFVYVLIFGVMSYSRFMVASCWPHPMHSDAGRNPQWCGHASTFLSFCELFTKDLHIQQTTSTPNI